jgi:cytochrome c biogenesis protein CcmG, thiol:disulfide interchange protein DsbE
MRGQARRMSRCGGQMDEQRTSAANKEIGKVTKAGVTKGEAVPAASNRGRTSRIGFLAPVAIFFGLAILFAFGLTRNARDLPSMLIGKPVPEFALPPVEGRTLGLSTADLRAKSPCSTSSPPGAWNAAESILCSCACKREMSSHPRLNYKDKPEDARNWLADLGDPYTRTGADLNGRVGIDFGVYGVPETFVVDKTGRIAHKHIGALDQRALDETILPLIAELRQAP